MSEGSSNKVGYGNPPTHSRFKKGQSGWPKGRPPGRHKEPPYEAVLGQMVTVREDGMENQVTAAEAFMRSAFKRATGDDGATRRQMLVAIEAAREIRKEHGHDHPLDVTIRFLHPGSINSPLESLRMVRILDRYRESARGALEPWIVEAALARLGERRLTASEQRTVVAATRTPYKVKWPEWWEIDA